MVNIFGKSKFGGVKLFVGSKLLGILNVWGFKKFGSIIFESQKVKGSNFRVLNCLGYKLFGGPNLIGGVQYFWVVSKFLGITYQISELISERIFYKIFEQIS